MQNRWDKGVQLGGFGRREGWLLCGRFGKGEVKVGFCFESRAGLKLLMEVWMGEHEEGRLGYNGGWFGEVDRMMEKEDGEDGI